MTETMKQIIDVEAMKRMITRLSYEIIEKNKGLEDVVLLGIRSRGSDIALRIAKRLEELEDTKVPVASIDITAYRDDKKADTTYSNQEAVQFSITDKKVILVDDVLYTGRTIRAALDAVMDLGRPQSISLVALVDRGHRELPIRADHVGKNIPTAKSEEIVVLLEETDGKDGIYLK